jgi:hypothetical protein
VTLFSVIKPTEPDEGVRNHLKSLSNRYTGQEPVNIEIVRNDDVLTGIRTYMESRNGILVVQKGTRTLADFFRKYVVDDMLHLSKVPLIILP